MNADALLAECEPIVRHQVRLFAGRAGVGYLYLDLRQDARIALWRAASDAPADDLHRVKWATVVIRNGAADGLRLILGREGSARHVGELSTVCADEAHASKNHAYPCRAASLVDVRRLIDRIAALPERQQRIVERLVDGLSGVEIAAELGVSPARFCQEAKALRAWVEAGL